VVVGAEGPELDDVWEARRGCYFAALSYTNSKCLFTDCCVPMSKLPVTLGAIEADFKARKVPCMLCCHIADGNFHVIVPYTDESLPAVHRMEDAMIERVLAAGGSVSGEHGVGVGKMSHIVKEHGPVYIDLMRRVKKALDPIPTLKAVLLPALAQLTLTLIEGT